MIVLGIRKLRESGSDVDKPISEPSVRCRIVPIKSSVALKPIRAKILHALVIQLERLHIRGASKANVSLIVVCDCDRGFTRNRRSDRYRERSSQAAARAEVVSD